MTDLMATVASASKRVNPESANALKPNDNRFIAPNPTYTDEGSFDRFLDEIKRNKNISAMQIDSMLQRSNIFLTEKQARDILRTISKESLNVGNSFIYHHAVFCRVVDRHNLREFDGAEGYYYVRDGVKPPDNYQVWDHQRGYLG